jgi:hypothetical protein
MENLFCLRVRIFNGELASLLTLREPTVALYMFTSRPAEEAITYHVKVSAKCVLYGFRHHLTRYQFETESERDHSVGNLLR